MQRIICALALVLGPVWAQAQSPTAAEQATANARLLAIPSAAGLVDQCPADIYKTEQSIWNRLTGSTAFETRASCRADFLTCLDACTENTDARACLHVGILLDQTDDDDLKLAARYSHALACAGGQRSGCTNRGGGIRNVRVEGDRLSLLTSDEKVSCLFDTFTLTCEAGDAWGCAMLGQAYHQGEGTAENTARAATLYARTCAMVSGPEISSCAFATRRLDQIGQN